MKDFNLMNVFCWFGAGLVSFMFSFSKICKWFSGGARVWVQMLGKKIRQDGVAVIFGMSQNGLCGLKLNLSGASIALNFNGSKKTESYKNEKSNILIPNYKQMNLTLFHISILNSFKKSQIYTPYF